MVWLATFVVLMGLTRYVVKDEPEDDTSAAA
jgi:hypothetical protein